MRGNVQRDGHWPPVGWVKIPVTLLLQIKSACAWRLTAARKKIHFPFDDNLVTFLP